jgi:hypothetical protein
MYCEEIMRGGVVRATAGENIETYRGWDVLINPASLKRWRAAEKLRRPAADEGACRSWLLQAMRTSPNKKTKAKLEWRLEAQRRYGVTIRAFNRAWKFACKESGSTWDQAGAMNKSLH